MSEGGPSDPLARLGERIDKAQGKRGGDPATESDNAALQQGVGVGLRIGVEFVVAIVVATALGWAIDHWLGSAPWGTIILFFLGVGAGMMNVYRAVTGINQSVGYRRLDSIKPRPSAKDDWDDDEE